MTFSAQGSAPEITGFYRSVQQYVSQVHTKKKKKKKRIAIWDGRVELPKCFCDQRAPAWVDHSVRKSRQCLSARRWAMRTSMITSACDWTRCWPACGKTDPLGEQRVLPQHRGIALAAPSTLNRLELSNNKDTRCHKVPHDPAKVEACLLKMGARCLSNT